MLHVADDGGARTLYDAAAPEVLDFVAAPDGGAYVAVLGSEASLVDLSRPTNGQSKDNDDEDDDSGVEVDESGAAAAAGSRVTGFRGPRSEILYWSPSGGVTRLWPFEDETVFRMLFADDRLWVATGLEGKLFSFQNDQMVLEKDVEEAQIVALVKGADGPSFFTTNAAALYRFTPGNERSGTLTSSVLDAERSARFGSLHWLGDAPAGTSVEFSLRTGMSALPDATWSDWTEPRAGDQIALGDLPRSRYLQWRLHMRSDNGSSPTVRGVDISYRQLNEKPEIESFTAMDPGQILVRSNFNPSNQVYEPAHPNRDGIFTTVGEPAPTSTNSLKTLWKGGYRTLRWKAEDPNEDELRFTLSFRREADGDAWLEMGADLEHQRYSFDSTVLPDGRYRFQLTASDRRGNVEGDALAASRISDIVVIDHTAPKLGDVAAGERITVSATDALSPLREAVYSVDAGDWRPAAADDGLIDGRAEIFEIPVEEGARLLLLRLTDAHFNVTTFDLTEHLP